MDRFRTLRPLLHHDIGPKLNNRVVIGKQPAEQTRDFEVAQAVGFQPAREPNPPDLGLRQVGFVIQGL